MDADRRARSLAALREGAAVIVAETEPRRTLRGLRGRVLAVHGGEIDAGFDNGTPWTRLGPATCDVLFDSTSESASQRALPVRVKAVDLMHAPASSRR